MSVKKKVSWAAALGMVGVFGFGFAAPISYQTNAIALTDYAMGPGTNTVSSTGAILHSITTMPRRVLPVTYSYSSIADTTTLTANPAYLHTVVITEAVAGIVTVLAATDTLALFKASTVEGTYDFGGAYCAGGIIIEKTGAVHTTVVWSEAESGKIIVYDGSAATGDTIIVIEPLINQYQTFDFGSLGVMATNGIVAVCTDTIRYTVTFSKR